MRRIPKRMIIDEGMPTLVTVEDYLYQVRRIMAERSPGEFLVTEGERAALQTALKLHDKAVGRLG